MGIFSLYTGLIYNDIFSQSLHVWHSAWELKDEGENRKVGVSSGHVYPFGLDPGWHGADNYLIFTNSLKMKLAVVLGISHVGIFSHFC